MSKTTDRKESSVFWDITPCIPLKITEVSEEYVTSMFRVEEYTKQETSMNS
jgi:hypothetical protein